MDQLLRHSITYRVAVDPQAGHKVFTLQTLLAGEPDAFIDTAGRVSGFSLHVGVAARCDERKKLERLCRYISRPAVVEKRLSLTPGGNIRYQLKTPYRDGTTHVIFESLEFLVRLATLAPRSRANLTRFHGVFAPNSKHRALITPVIRGKGNKRRVNSKTDDCTPAERHAAMTWAQRLKRVFDIDVATCELVAREPGAATRRPAGLTIARIHTVSPRVTSRRKRRDSAWPGGREWTQGVNERARFQSYL